MGQASGNARGLFLLQQQISELAGRGGDQKKEVVTSNKGGPPGGLGDTSLHADVNNGGEHAVRRLTQRQALTRNSRLSRPRKEGAFPHNARGNKGKSKRGASGV